MPRGLSAVMNYRPPFERHTYISLAPSFMPVKMLRPTKIGTITT